MHKTSMNHFPLLRRWGLALVLATALSACQTTITRKFPSPGANWKSSYGQLQYVSPKRSVIGEAVIARHGRQDFQLDYTAGPGVPLIRVRESDNSAGAEGVFAQLAWQGEPAKAPHHLRPWIELRDVFAAIDARSKKNHVSVHGPAGTWNAQAELAAGQLKRVRVEFPRNKERLTFVFAR